jgi:hypothetical protein
MPPPPPPPSSYWSSQAQQAQNTPDPSILSHVDYSDLDPRSMDFAYAWKDKSSNSVPASR